MSNDERRTAMIRLLDAHELQPAAVAARNRSHDLLRLAPGARVADVGCGTGRAAAELHVRGARVTGVDVDPAILGLARERWPFLDLREADACALPFADGELDAYRADKVLHALADPAAAVREAYRVLAPGGRVVLTGQDWDALAVDSDDPGLTRAVVASRAATVGSPRAARAYRSLLLDAGFTDVAARAETALFTDPGMLPVVVNIAAVAKSAGTIGAADADAWIAEQTRRAATDRMFLAMPVFTASGTRP